MVPSARVSDVRTMGEGKHARFSLHSGAHRALGVAFGRSSLGVEDDEPVDAAVRLEVNHWNGSVEPSVVLSELYPLEEPIESGCRPSCVSGEAEWWRRFEAERAPSGRRPRGGLVDFVACGGELAQAHPERVAVQGEAPVNDGDRRACSSPAAPGCSRCAPTPPVAPPSPAAPPASPASTAAPPESPVQMLRLRGPWKALGARAGGGLALTDYMTLLAGAEVPLRCEL